VTILGRSHDNATLKKIWLASLRITHGSHSNQEIFGWLAEMLVGA
jgi:hypothetical protein